MDARPTDESNTPDEAAQLGLAVVAQATALNSSDDAVLHSAAENLRDTVDEMIDEPMTARQEEVVESLGTVAGSLLAGASGALAAEQNVPVEHVLNRTARVVLGTQGILTDDENDQHDR